jgi:hypothetical protein
MAEHEPNRPNYSELSKAQEPAQQNQQQQEAIQEPPRPDRLRAPVWSADPGMGPQQRSAIEHIGWKQGSNNPAVAQEMQQKLEQERAAQRGNEGPQHDQTDGRKR